MGVGEGGGDGKMLGWVRYEGGIDVYRLNWGWADDKLRVALVSSSFFISNVKNSSLLFLLLLLLLLLFLLHLNNDTRNKKLASLSFYLEDTFFSLSILGLFCGGNLLNGQTFAFSKKRFGPFFEEKETFRLRLNGFMR